MADDDIPITDPNFYSSESLCPDSLIEYIFRPVDQSSETIPLLQQRITIMREVGFVLCNVSFEVCRVPALNNLVFQSFGGSFQGFIDEFHRRYNGEGTALELVQMVTDMFPSFRDEVYYEGQKSAELRIPKSHVADHHGDLFSLSLPLHTPSSQARVDLKYTSLPCSPIIAFLRSCIICASSTIPRIWYACFMREHTCSTAARRS